MSKSAATNRKSTPRPTPTAAAPAPSAHHAEVKPSSDQIRRRAYEIYARRLATGAHGTAESDWLEAERELARRA